jgi:hypothetical protein
MLGWTVRELAPPSVVSIATINAIDETNVPSSFRKGDLEAIQPVLEEGGIEFTNGDELGVKLKAKKKRAMIRKRRFAESLVRKRSIKIGGRSSNANAVSGSSSFRLFVLRLYQDETQELATWRKQQSE